MSLAFLTRFPSSNLSNASQPVYPLEPQHLALKQRYEPKQPSTYAGPGQAPRWSELVFVYRLFFQERSL